MSDLQSPKATQKSVKIQLQSQLQKLNLRVEAELEYLEALREYMSKRADLENLHAKETQDVLLRMMAIKTINQPPLVYASFSTLLTESDSQSKKQIELSESLSKDISDVLKEFSKLKTINSRENVEFAAKYQQEILLAYDEHDKFKALYEKQSKDADAAQKKYDEALRRPKSGMQSLKTLVTGKDAATVMQNLKTKAKQKSRVLNECRNKYLLALAGLNSLQKLYDEEGLPSLMQKLYGSFCPTIRDAILKYSALQEELCQEIGVGVLKIKEQTSQISHEKDQQVFVSDFQSIFKPAATFQFECNGTDKISTIVVDELTKITLGQIYGDLIIREEMLSAESNLKVKELQGAQQLVNVYTATPSTGNAAHPLELVHELQNTLDLLNCQALGIDTQISILKSLDITPIMPPKPDLLNPPLSTSSVKKIAMVLYSYSTDKPDELSVAEGDEVEILQLDNKGWTQAKLISSGATGLIPTNYIQEVILKSHATEPLTVVTAVYDYKGTDKGELSFVVGDTIECLYGVDMDEEWWEGKLVRTNSIGIFPVLCTQGWEAVASTFTSKNRSVSGLRSRQVSRQTPSIHSIKMVNVTAVKGEEESIVMIDINNSAKEYQSAIVVYDYEATCAGELSLELGETISITNQNIGSDEWWEGVGKNGSGQFPSNYVEKIEKSERVVERVESNVRALYDYDSSNPGDLSFKADDIIRITQSVDTDWWDGELNGMTGSFPASYVEKY